MTPDLLQIGLDHALIAYFGTAFDVDPASPEYKGFVAGWNGDHGTSDDLLDANSYSAGLFNRAAYEREVANAAAALESESTASGE